MSWRLGVDLGANSLGWAALRLDEPGRPAGILAAGSRIFSDGRDPKSGSSLAVDRRNARAMRRRRDRFKQRQSALIKHLTRDGLFPAEPSARRDLQALDPYELRAKALDSVLTPHEVGRAIFHLNQRRGFKSNRKTDRGDADEAGKIATGVERLREKIVENGARTFGEFLNFRRCAATDKNAIPSVRARLRPERGEGAKGDGYDFYPGRSLLEEEFNAIWHAQCDHHPRVLTEEVHDRLFEIVFSQRPLKPARVGTCTLMPGDQRLAKAHPLFQKRRLLEEVNALMIVRPGENPVRLTLDQRDALLLKLKGSRKVSFATLRKLLKLGPEARFNKESESRPELIGDEVAAEMGSKARFGVRWALLSVDDQWTVLNRLINEEDSTALVCWLEKTWTVSHEAAKACAAARLPSGYGRFGKTATERLIAALEASVIVYSEAVTHAGLGHHSDFRTGEVHGRLPYYGLALERHIMPGTGEPSDPEEMRVGRLTNPTVHIGLNQLRRVVNRLIDVYGAPSEIAIELARELKLNEEDKKRLNRENNENRKSAELRAQKLRELGVADNGANRARLKLWEELDAEDVLDRRCVYSGRPISISDLFSPSVEVDHILPWAATLDDSGANRIVCFREANREKRKRSPYEAWGHTEYWDGISARAAKLPRNKRWRFEPDAMAKFADEESFLARHLVDTQYLSRMAREYLSTLYPETGQGSGRVWVSPGRLTELVRRKLGLNDLLPDHNFGGGADQPKNRLDHRHHAIDAAVVAIVDRSLLNAMARASGREGLDGRERIIVPEPWEGFRDELRQAVNRIVVSHRPDHGSVSKRNAKRGRDATAGRLHNDTAYGLTGEIDEKGNNLVVHRVSLGSLTKPTDIERVRDDDLRRALGAFTAGFDGKAFESRVVQFPELGPLHYRGLRRVRMTKPLSVIPIRDAAGESYKGYKGDSNFRFDVWEGPDGKWTAEVVSMFDAHQPNWCSTFRTDNPAARKVLSLRQNDFVMIEHEAGASLLMRVVKFDQNGQVTLAAPQEAGDLKRRHASAADTDPFKYFAPTAGGLKRIRTRQVRVDEIGTVYDPGFAR